MDISLNINDVKFNYRTCLMIIKNDCILVEGNDEDEYVLLPGGRVKTNEDTKNGIIREMEEELGYKFNKEDLIDGTFYENFFTYENQKVHELMFVYKVYVDDSFPIKDNDKNLDSFGNYYKWINKNNLDSVKLVPKSLKEIIDTNEFIHVIDRDN